MVFLPMPLHFIFVVAVPSWFPALIVFAWSLAGSHSVTSSALKDVDNEESLRAKLFMALGTRDHLILKG